MCPPRAFKKYLRSIKEIMYILLKERWRRRRVGRVLKNAAGRYLNKSSSLMPARALAEREERRARAQECRRQEFLHVVFAYAHVAC